MNTQQKNVEIAKMLEWKYLSHIDIKEGNYHESITAGWYSSVPQILAMKMNIDLYKCRSHNNLKFSSDCNWQNIALNYIEKEYLCSTIIMSDFIGANAINDKKLSYWVVIDKHFKDEMGKTVNDLLPEEFMSEYFPERKQAIFEALFQFSQYLKEKK